MNKLTRTNKRGRPPHQLTPDVERLWIDSDGRLSTREIWSRVNLNKPEGVKEIDLRIVQNIVARLRRETGDISRRSWTPWDEHTTPHLLVLDLISSRLFDRSLSVDEADWAVALEDGVVELDPFIQLVIVREYAIRNRIAKILGEPSASTTDLDILLAIRPWDDGGELWELASITEVETPSLFSLDFRTSADVNIKDLEVAASRNLRDWFESSLGILSPARFLPNVSQLTWHDFVKDSYRNRTPEDTAAQWARVSPDTGNLE